MSLQRTYCHTPRYPSASACCCLLFREFRVACSTTVWFMMAPKHAAVGAEIGGRQNMERKTQAHSLEHRRREPWGEGSGWLAGWGMRTPECVDGRLSRYQYSSTKCPQPNTTLSFSPRLMLPFAYSSTGTYVPGRAGHIHGCGLLESAELWAQRGAAPDSRQTQHE